MSRLRLVVSFLALALTACATAREPIRLDGADRVPINDLATIAKLKRMAAESADAEDNASPENHR